jgi:hypothetical protein
MFEWPVTIAFFVVLLLLIFQATISISKKFSRRGWPPPGIGPSLAEVDRETTERVSSLLREVVLAAKDADEAFAEMKRIVEPRYDGPRLDGRLTKIAIQYAAGRMPTESIESYARRTGQVPRRPTILLDTDEEERETDDE